MRLERLELWDGELLLDLDKRSLDTEGRKGGCLLHFTEERIIDEARRFWLRGRTS